MEVGRALAGLPGLGVGGLLGGFALEHGLAHQVLERGAGVELEIGLVDAVALVEGVLVVLDHVGDGGGAECREQAVEEAGALVVGEVVGEKLAETVKGLTDAVIRERG